MRFWSRLKFIFQFRKSIPFLKDYFASREVTITAKVIAILLMIGYVVFPFDLIPDWLLAIGVLDDVMIVSLILQQMVKMAPERLREKHKLNH
ncbi:hypothetical protein J416_11045 [Gracilibacillus halophilus YIM-C55.5]|uniref:DUF1232 domain-containing protein n=1 Tax=Gracilibacillus halophilus YIM-C55.5 TaxID=1308866 RepID=N4WPG7_9BACI|nr:DUF1232 domain-containing protein [Gracilibacillus halophilus]ENH96375.1 hypothetical protein J416_11045 [Gracilibacillus halophilus YIM-C55.5]